MRIWVKILEIGEYTVLADAWYMRSSCHFPFHTSSATSTVKWEVGNKQKCYLVTKHFLPFCSYIQHLTQLWLTSFLRSNSLEKSLTSWFRKRLILKGRISCLSMGLELGNLPIRIRRTLYFGLSPMEQRVWAKSVSRGLPNTFRRTISSFPAISPAFFIMTFLYCWADGEHRRVNCKDPRDYENDE